MILDSPLIAHRAGGGILLSTGDQWHRNRKLLTKLFFFGRLKSYGPPMNKACESLIADLHQTHGQTVRWLRSLRHTFLPHLSSSPCSRRQVEPFGLLMQHTMRMICLLAFGGRIDADRAFHLYEELSKRFQNEYMLAYIFFGPMVNYLTFLPPVYRINSVTRGAARGDFSLLFLSSLLLLLPPEKKTYNKSPGQ